MDERSARLHTHQKNIDRYQGLLKIKPSEAEKQSFEKRLSEERVARAMLDPHQEGYDLAVAPD